MSAVNLATAWVQIVPSLRGAQKQIESQLAGVDVSQVGSKLGGELSNGMGKSLDFNAVGAKLQSIGGGLKDVGGKLTNSITKPALAATGVVGGLVAALGFKRLVGIDTARGQFKGLGHDADAVMKQVDKGVNETALTMAQGASLAVGILATGNLPLNQLESQLKRVANVSAAYGVDSAQAGYLLNNVLTKNKVTYGDLSQMVQNGIPIISDLAKHYGVTGDEIESMAQRGEISIADFNAVLDKNAGAAAEAYAGTWEGITANILANLGKIGAKMMGPSFDILKDKAANLLAFLQSKDLSAWAEQAGAKIGEFVGKAAAGVEKLIGWWSGLDAGQQKLIGSLAGIAVAAGPVLTVVGKLVSGVGGMVAMGGQFTGFLSSGTKGAQMLGGALRFLMGPWGLLIAGIAAAVATSPELQAVLGQLVQTIGGALGSVLQAVMPIFQQIIAAVQPIIDSLMPLLADVFRVVGDVVRTVFEALGPIIQGALTIVSGIIKVVTSAIQGDWSGVWEGIKQIFAGIWETIKAVVIGAINIVASVISGAISIIKSVWNAAWGAISTFFTNIWNGIVSAGVRFGLSIRSKFEEVVNFVKGVPGKVIGFFANLGSSLINSGKSLIEGFLNGIMDGFNWAKQKVSDGLSAIRDLFPFSPAKEGPFSGRGWVLYSGISLGETFTGAIADSLRDGRSEVAGEMDGIAGEFSRIEEYANGGTFSVRSAMPDPGRYGGGVTINQTFEGGGYDEDALARKSRNQLVAVLAAQGA